MGTIVAEEEKKKPPLADGASPEKLSSNALPCMDRLREELSCAICLEICFEPSTTPCGHSFCMKCLKYAAAKCGKRCPKCRQLIRTIKGKVGLSICCNRQIFAHFAKGSQSASERKSRGR